LACREENLNVEYVRARGKRKEARSKKNGYSLKGKGQRARVTSQESRVVAAQAVDRERY